MLVVAEACAHMLVNCKVGTPGRCSWQDTHDAGIVRQCSKCEGPAPSSDARVKGLTVEPVWLRLLGPIRRTCMHFW